MRNDAAHNRSSRASILLISIYGMLDKWTSNVGPKDCLVQRFREINCRHGYTSLRLPRNKLVAFDDGIMREPCRLVNASLIRSVIGAFQVVVRLRSRRARRRRLRSLEAARAVDLPPG
jgi:hypothetical protein